MIGVVPPVDPLQRVVHQVIELALGTVVAGSGSVGGDHPSVAHHGAQVDLDAEQLAVPFGEDLVEAPGVGVEVELIDEALGRVLARVAERGWADDVDVVVTTDHGELQGDFGLLFKGPYHVDALMRIPLVWRPAPSTRAEGSTPTVVTRPVGLVDLAPTFCAIAGIHPPEWMQGKPLPVDDTDAESRGFDKVLTEWDSELFGISVHLRTMMRDRWVVTAYRPGTSHDGTEGELYDLVDDPLQQVNRWDDVSVRPLRDDLVADLWASQPAVRSERLCLEAPV